MSVRSRAAPWFGSRRWPPTFSERCAAQAWERWDEANGDALRSFSELHASLEQLLYEQAHLRSWAQKGNP